MELKLLYSYEEYKNNKTNCGISGNIQSITDTAVRLLQLSTLSSQFGQKRTDEEQEEYDRLQKENRENAINEKYTKLTHEITDLFYDLKDTHDNKQRKYKYVGIGRKQCEIEMMKEKYNN